MTVLPDSTARGGRRFLARTARPGGEGLRAAIPFLLPAVGLYALFTLLPIADTLRLSVTASDSPPSR